MLKREKDFQTNLALEFFAQASRRQKELEFPVKHHQPKTARLASPRQRAAFAQPQGPRALWRDADKAEQDWRGVAAGDESIMTRNVGPNDMGSNYCHGKETGFTGIRWGKPER
jgi:hypothetical protein